MLEDRVAYVYERRDGNGWKEEYRSEDPARVYDGLAHCLIAKYVYKVEWIERMVWKPRYDDYVTIMFYENNGGRRTYTVER